MQVYKQYPAKDINTLKRVTEHYGHLANAYDKIERAYQAYDRSDGSPQMPPLRMSRAEISCLHAVYENAAKMLGLDWITQVKAHVAQACPMCGSNTLGTVEHYLPKTPFPEFSIYSKNLIPSCTDCNGKRGNRHKNGVEEKFIHPILDTRILGRLSLITRFNVSGRSVSFRLGYNEAAFSNAECRRISFHIKMNVLDKAYKRGTLVYRSELAARLDGITAEAQVCHELEKELRILTTCKGAHSWRGALLRGLLEVDHAQRLTILQTSKISLARTARA